MSVFTPKSLLSMQLPAVQAALYTAPTGTKALIHNIVLHNTSGSTAYTPSLYINNGTTSFRIWSASLVANNTVIIDFGNEGLVLEPGYSLQGQAGTAEVINIIVSGMERV